MGVKYSDCALGWESVEGELTARAGWEVLSALTAAESSARAELSARAEPSAKVEVSPPFKAEVFIACCRGELWVEGNKNSSRLFIVNLKPLALFNFNVDRTMTLEDRVQLPECQDFFYALYYPFQEIWATLSC